MGAHSRECFHENLHKDDKMTVTFQVGDREFGGSGNLEIDFWVCKKLLCANSLKRPTSLAAELYHTTRDKEADRDYRS